ncbi:hypothetical protein AM10699_24190 [Acaryochloris marina MBIC10699]|nr:hypothetical protein AM10699_24190 [Acaryochloris marina MBIC10699]
MVAIKLGAEAEAAMPTIAQITIFSARLNPASDGERLSKTSDLKWNIKIQRSNINQDSKGAEKETKG